MTSDSSAHDWPTEVAAAAVPEAEVVGAVQTAAGATTLPATITNAALLAASGDDESQWAVPGCTPSREETRLDDISGCMLGDVDSERTIALIGDSGAAMWHGAFDLIGQRNGWKVLVLTKNNCGPAAVTYYQYQLERAFTECDDWQKWRMEVLQKEQPEVVVLAGWYGGNLGPDREVTPEVWRDGLAKTASQLPTATRVVMLGNAPHPEENPSECVALNSTDLSRCSMPAAAVLPNQTGWSTAAEAVGGTYIDVNPWFCTDVCPAVVGDHLVYAGEHHITNEYAEYLSGSIENHIVTALA
ncbi:SGNH hydrolase domain-containing protein [Rhodococcus gannanensis]|uniref:SGNH hydrolase domain-containing protein n=1 Tax=Rhodococcus gannanensis TaxID=1960308 RepID=A0ABW4P7A4_9NOCA